MVRSPRTRWTRTKKACDRCNLAKKRVRISFFLALPRLTVGLSQCELKKPGGRCVRCKRNNFLCANAIASHSCAVTATAPRVPDRPQSSSGAAEIEGPAIAIQHPYPQLDLGARYHQCTGGPSVTSGTDEYIRNDATTSGFANSVAALTHRSTLFVSVSPLNITAILADAFGHRHL
jgi:hypothetical protein